MNQIRVGFDVPGRISNSLSFALDAPPFSFVNRPLKENRFFAGCSVERLASRKRLRRVESEYVLFMLDVFDGMEEMCEGR